ncbi:unnamed protein product [Schistocephalus solidus]|uniref:Uncharacterized protein n=1 Tax=Schistocephalus solidus TaxID=70667 RepID=A0A3P7D3A3_SCHSO|nr:unnamed protein product [Schistocephalus solidus]
MLDYVLVRRRDRQDVLVTKAIRDVDGWTDHRLSTALENLGRARRQNQDWFDENNADISNILAEKNALHKAYMDLRTDATKAAFFRCRRLVQQRLREMQDTWMIRKAEEIQGYADRNEMNNFFKAIKAIYGPCIKGSAPLLSSDGTTLLREKSQILKRWVEHFINVLTCSSAITDAAIDRLHQVDTNNDLNLPPSLPETIRAVQLISSGKAPGYDALPPEVYKHADPSKDARSYAAVVVDLSAPIFLHRTSCDEACGLNVNEDFTFNDTMISSDWIIRPWRS